MNYSKWDNLPDDSDKDQSPRATTAAASAVAHTAGRNSSRLDDLQRIKAKTDAIMTDADFQTALRGYHELLSMLPVVPSNRGLEAEEILQLHVSCRLGAACCLLKTDCYGEALPHILEALEMPGLSEVQRVRALYFKAVALSHAEPEAVAALEEAQTACISLFAILRRNPEIAVKSQELEYSHLNSIIGKQIGAARLKLSADRFANLHEKAVKVLGPESHSDLKSVIRHSDFSSL